MNIFINDDMISISETLSLSDALAKHVDEHSHYAVAVNLQFIPKHAYNMKLNENDRIDIIIPMQGG